MNDQAFYVQAALWSQVIASAVFLGVLVWLWTKYLQPAILGAQERHNQQLAQAERHRDEAKAALELLNTEIETAGRDAQSIKERAATQADHETAAAIAGAQEAGERGLRDAQGEYERAMLAARDRLRIELLEKALAKARVEAAARIDAAAERRIVDGFVGALERKNG